MRFFKNHSIGFYLGFVLILAMTIGASAIATLADSGPITAALVAGSLTETSDFSGASVSVTLTGKDQTPSYKLPITVTDATGSGAGWHLTITSTPFKTAGPPSISLNPRASHITGITAQCQVGNNCTAPTSISHPISYPLLVPTASATPSVSEFFSADMNSGMGIIIVTPTISVKIPGNAYAATYTSSITLGIVSGP